MPILGSRLDLNSSHLEALDWFSRFRGQVVTWAAMKEHAEHGARLVNQAKGIYKPEYTDYALSVRQTLDSPYADLEMVHREDGSWVYPYFQENKDPKKRDAESTNRGLVKCMSDGVPVGVLIQTKPKPGVEYWVAGPARVIGWENGYFFLEGFTDTGELSPHTAQPNIALDRARAEALKHMLPDFSYDRHKDERVRVISEVVRRMGQPKFRKALLGAYDGRCAITDCDAVEALEAAHITPYLGSHTNHPQNGLLLRSDIHALFDMGRLGVDPASRRVVLAKTLKSTSYAELQGRLVRYPVEPEKTPSEEALAEHLRWAGLEAEL